MGSRAQKNKNQKGCLGEKIVKWEIKSMKKKRPKENKNYLNVNCPLGDNFIPSMKSRNGIFWMVH